MRRVYVLRSGTSPISRRSSVQRLISLISIHRWIQVKRILDLRRNDGIAGLAAKQS